MSVAPPIFSLVLNALVDKYTTFPFDEYYGSGICRSGLRRVYLVRDRGRLFRILVYFQALPWSAVVFCFI